MPYVKEYLSTIGERKCEANAIVVMPDEARQLMTDSIEYYVGPDALTRFQDKRTAIKKELDLFMEESGIKNTINEALDKIEDHG